MVRTDGLRAVYGHVITNFFGTGRFSYPWYSSSALRARSTAILQNKANISLTERLLVFPGRLKWHFVEFLIYPYHY